MGGGCCGRYVSSAWNATPSEEKSCGIVGGVRGEREAREAREARDARAGRVN